MSEKYFSGGVLSPYFISSVALEVMLVWNVVGVVHSLILDSKYDSKPTREFLYFCLPMTVPVCPNVMGHILK